MLEAGPLHPLPGEQPTAGDHRSGGSVAGGPAATGADPLAMVGAVLLLAAGALTVAALWPAFYTSAGGHTALADSADQIVPTGVVAAGWLTAAGLVGSRRTPLIRAGAAVAAGLAWAYLGLLVADLGQLTVRGTGGGAGLWLLTGAWVAGLLGATVALATVARRGAMAQLLGRGGGTSRSGDRVVAVAVAVAAVALAVAFFPSWDRYLVSSLLDPSVSTSITAGDAFKYPALTIAGNVWAGASFGVVPVAALALRSRRLGALLGAGVLVAAVSQVLSAVVQTLETPVLAQVVPAQLLRLDPAVSLHLTGWFDLEFASLLVLAVSLAVWATRDGAPAGSGTSLAWVGPVDPQRGWGQQLPAWAPAGPVQEWGPPPGVGAGGGAGGGAGEQR